jgi:hypothetical protein
VLGLARSGRYGEVIPRTGASRSQGSFRKGRVRQPPELPPTRSQRVVLVQRMVGASGLSPFPDRLMVDSQPGMENNFQVSAFLSGLCLMTNHGGSALRHTSAQLTFPESRRTHFTHRQPL